LLGVMVIVKSRPAIGTRRLAHVGVLVAVVAVVLAPWIVRNLTGFSRPVFFSTNGDQVLGVAHCQPTYYDHVFMGYWSVACNGHGDVADDAERTSLERTRGLHYLRTHLDRFLGTVVWARLGRVSDLWDPFGN